jgi:hypothetical protein
MGKKKRMGVGEKSVMELLRKSSEPVNGVKEILKKGVPVWMRPLAKVFV